MEAQAGAIVIFVFVVIAVAAASAVRFFFFLYFALCLCSAEKSKILTGITSVYVSLQIFRVPFVEQWVCVCVRVNFFIQQCAMIKHTYTYLSIFFTYESTHKRFVEVL